MSETAPIVKVVYRVYDPTLSLATAFLVRTEHGACWAYFNEADLGKDPISAGAQQLDERLLELLPPQPDEPPAYLYRGVFRVPRQAERMPPSLLAAARSTKPPTTRH